VSAGWRARQYTPSTEARAFYRRYSTAEDKERTNRHYDLPAEFFLCITGGEWNTYSCNLWESAATETESQEQKLDLLAGLMGLRPGQRILDVGCGWGGPLTYLCKTYGVQGVGLTLSPSQKAVADERSARYGVDVQIIESHWQDYEDDNGFDAVYTDEVLVHFHDLSGYFQKVRSLLHDDGLMLNKELHFAHPRYAHDLNRSSAFVNEIFGATGNYRTLAEELLLLEESNFELRTIQQMSLANFRETIDHWIINQRRSRERLESLVGSDYYRQFLTYLKICRRYVLSGNDKALHIVVAQK
jgi:cyclopropane-fatty-acyl-phospholipid synthase